MSTPDQGGGNYQAAVRKFAEEGGVVRGRFNEIAILHDDWCKLLKGTGPCNCEPEIKSMKVHGDIPEGPPFKLRPKEPILWARLQRIRRRPA